MTGEDVAGAVLLALAAVIWGLAAWRERPGWDRDLYLAMVGAHLALAATLVLRTS